MANYSNIIGNWSSAAQKGRSRAKQELQIDIKTAQTNNDAKLLEQQNEQLVQQQLELSNQQADTLSKQYRPKDLENMKVVAEDAQNEIKSQLEFYGDDLTKFMRAGGMQHLQTYRDSILNSDEAKTIRANHKGLTQYLNNIEDNPDLVSKIDHKGFENWKSGKVNAFVYHGQYHKLEKPESVEGYNSLGEAYLDNNFDKVIFNFNLDNNTTRAPIEHGGDVTSDELINYLNSNYLGEQHMTKDFKEELSAYKNNSKLASEQLSIMNGSLNRGYTGDFNNFWEDSANANVLENLRQRTGAGTFDNQAGGIYGSRIFNGQEGELISNIFNIDEKDYNGTIHKDEINNLLKHGEIQAYDTDGNSMKLGETFGYWYGGNLEVESINYGLEVTTDYDNNKTKILSYDDVSADGDDSGLNKNKAKDGIITVALRDPDNLTGDDFIYVKIDMNNASMAKKFDNAVGDMEYKSKTAAETSPGQYTYIAGEKFSFTGNNPKNAITTLHNPLDINMKSIGVTEYDPYIYSAVMAHSLSMTQDGIEPQQFMNLLTTSQDPVMKEAVQNLVEGDISGYINVFKENNKMTKNEATKLQRDIQQMIMGYNVLGQQLNQ